MSRFKLWISNEDETCDETITAPRRGLVRRIIRMMQRSAGMMHVSVWSKGSHHCHFIVTKTLVAGRDQYSVFDLKNGETCVRGMRFKKNARALRV